MSNAFERYAYVYAKELGISETSCKTITNACGFLSIISSKIDQLKALPYSKDKGVCFHISKTLRICNIIIIPCIKMNDVHVQCCQYIINPSLFLLITIFSQEIKSSSIDYVLCQELESCLISEVELAISLLQCLTKIYSDPCFLQTWQLVIKACILLARDTVSHPLSPSAFYPQSRTDQSISLPSCSSYPFSINCVRVCQSVFHALICSFHSLVLGPHRGPDTTYAYHQHALHPHEDKVDNSELDRDRERLMDPPQLGSSTTSMPSRVESSSECEEDSESGVIEDDENEEEDGKTVSSAPPSCGTVPCSVPPRSHWLSSVFVYLVCIQSLLPSIDIRSITSELQRKELTHALHVAGQRLVAKVVVLSSSSNDSMDSMLEQGHLPSDEEYEQRASMKSKLRMQSEKILSLCLSILIAIDANNETIAMVVQCVRGCMAQEEEWKAKPTMSITPYIKTTLFSNHVSQLSSIFSKKLSLSQLFVLIDTPIVTSLICYGSIVQYPSYSLFLHSICSLSFSLSSLSSLYSFRLPSSSSSSSLASLLLRDVMQIAGIRIKRCVISDSYVSLCAGGFLSPSFISAKEEEEREKRRGKEEEREDVLDAARLTTPDSSGGCALSWYPITTLYNPSVSSLTHAAAILRLGNTLPVCDKVVIEAHTLLSKTRSRFE
ncbi:hypothetical protein ADUPG1_009369 [Aduncisulcus paluster]|uniref:Uncharacterized protein n=1 Tax=Aduncisulcus paluster TaxID=2918883 RepID=A0ABQ5KVB2_9EUKA|nr:hypothetical protein ADUPG1_009369 [Aduncisulcus paluster]